VWYSSQLAALGLTIASCPKIAAAAIGMMTTRAPVTIEANHAALACPWMRRRWRRRRHIWDAYWTVPGVRSAGVRVEPQGILGFIDLAAGRVGSPMNQSIGKHLQKLQLLFGKLLRC